MKQFAIALTISTIFTGCGTSLHYEKLGDGYVEANYARTSWEPSATRSALLYKHGWRMIKIWPSMDGVRPIVRDGVTVFVAMKALGPPDQDNPRAVDSRVFAVRSPGLPLDITSEILLRWSKETGGDFARFNEATGVVLPEQKDNGIEFHIATGSDKNNNIFYNWSQILDIMREVQKNGVVRRDRVWDARYIARKIRPGE